MVVTIDLNDRVTVNGQTYVRLLNTAVFKKQPVEHGSKPWTPEADAKLLKMHAEGRSASDIGGELGRSVTAVHSRIHNLKKRKKGS